jgi:hypothetical protein
MTTRLTFLLLITVLIVVTFGSTRDASSTSTYVANRNAPADNLRTYYVLSNLPINETKASFRNASAKNKSDLWRTHLALSIVNHPELNERQRKVILAAISLATPEFFEVRSTDSDWTAKVQEPLHSLEEQIINLFTVNDAIRIFANLQDSPEILKCGATFERSILKTVNYKPPINSGSHIQSEQRANSRFGEQDKGIGLERNTCGCSTDSDWCPISGYCKLGNCSPTQSGCGTLWSYPCNGNCS